MNRYEKDLYKGPTQVSIRETPAKPWELDKHREERLKNENNTQIVHQSSSAK